MCFVSRHPRKRVVLIACLPLFAQMDAKAEISRPDIARRRQQSDSVLKIELEARQELHQVCMTIVYPALLYIPGNCWCPCVLL
jgi:hypothetical protein